MVKIGSFHVHVPVLKSKTDSLPIVEMETCSSDVNHIDRLPDELLASIIRHLTWWRDKIRVERVSSRWQRVAKQSGWNDFTEFDTQMRVYQPNQAVSTISRVQHVLPR